MFFVGGFGLSVVSFMSVMYRCVGCVLFYFIVDIYVFVVGVRCFCFCDEILGRLVFVRFG